MSLLTTLSSTPPQSTAFPSWPSLKSTSILNHLPRALAFPRLDHKSLLPCLHDSTYTFMKMTCAFYVQSNLHVSSCAFTPKTFSLDVVSYWQHESIRRHDFGRHCVVKPKILKHNSVQRISNSRPIFERLEFGGGCYCTPEHFKRHSRVLQRLSNVLKSRSHQTWNQYLLQKKLATESTLIHALITNL